VPIELVAVAHLAPAQLADSKVGFSHNIHFRVLIGNEFLW